MPSEKNHRKVGRNLIRPDALEKVTGKAIYTDDLTFSNMLFAHVKRAEVPHAILRGVDISQAQAFPGVLAVLTAKDLPGARNHGLVSPDWPILVGVGERIRYVGDAVAILAAESEDIANQALELIKIEIEQQSVVTGPVEASQPASTHPARAG